MPVAKIKMNGYALFAQSYKKDHNIRSTPQAFEEAASMWNTMPLESKMDWKDKAKKWNEEMPDEEKPRKKRNKAATTRKTIKNLLRPAHCHRAEEIKRAQRPPYLQHDNSVWAAKRKDDVEAIKGVLFFSAPSVDVVGMKKFIEQLREEGPRFLLMTVVPYYDNGDNVVVPAEIVTMEFSMGSGTLNAKHWMIPPEYADMEEIAAYYDSGDCADHGISAETVGDEDIPDTVEDIFEALNQELDRKFVFVLYKEYNMVNAAYYWLKNQIEGATADQDFTVSHKFRCLEDLMSAYLLLLGDDLGASEVEDMSPASKFPEYDLHPQMTCNFHRHVGNPNCAVTKANKMFMSMCWEMRKKLNLDLTDVRYFPKLVLTGGAPSSTKGASILKSFPLRPGQGKKGQGTFGQGKVIPGRETEGGSDKSSEISEKVEKMMLEEFGQGDGARMKSGGVEPSVIYAGLVNREPYGSRMGAGSDSGAEKRTPVPEDVRISKSQVLGAMPRALPQRMVREESEGQETKNRLAKGRGRGLFFRNM